MDYIIPEGRLQGRALGSLTLAEQQTLRRTRTSTLQEARDRLAGRFTTPPPQPEEPLPCLPLARIQRPRWPPDSRPAPWRPFWNSNRMMKIFLTIFILILIHPPLAAFPGLVIGYSLRLVGLRLREAGSIFFGTITNQISDIVSDSVSWVEDYLWPFSGFQPDPKTPPAPGQRVMSLIFGLAALKVLRPWG